MRARYHAPAVAYDFVRPFEGGVVLCLTWLALLLLLLGWCLQPQAGLSQVLLSGLVLSLAALLLYRQWRHWPAGRLHWDGEQWQLELDHQRAGQMEFVQVSVGLDGTGWFWLRISHVLTFESKNCKDRVLWIFMSQQHSPQQWGDLRRAVYCSVQLQTQQG